MANQPTTETAASPAADQTPSAGLEPEQTSNTDLVAAATPVITPEASPNTPATEPESSAQAQDTASASRDTGTESQPTTASRSTSSTKKKSVASTSKRARATQNYGQRRRPTGSMRARVVGITSDGRLIFRSSSGRTVIVTPGSESEDELAPSRRRRDFVPQARDEFSAPSQRFPPDYFPDD